MESVCLISNNLACKKAVLPTSYHHWFLRGQSRPNICREKLQRAWHWSSPRSYDLKINQGTSANKLAKAKEQGLLFFYVASNPTSTACNNSGWDHAHGRWNLLAPLPSLLLRLWGRYMSECTLSDTCWNCQQFHSLHQYSHEFTMDKFSFTWLQWLLQCSTWMTFHQDSQCMHTAMYSNDKQWFLVSLLKDISPLVNI